MASIKVSTTYFLELKKKEKRKIAKKEELLPPDLGI